MILVMLEISRIIFENSTLVELLDDKAYHSGFYYYCPTLSKFRIPLNLEKLFHVSVHFTR